MNKKLAREIYKASYITGEFVLRSGQVSNEYFDKYLFESDPAILAQVAEELSTKLPEGIDLIAGLEMGGIPVCTAISLHSGHHTLFVRKKAKEYGTCKLAEGENFKGKIICVIEDVVTTGGQIIQSVKELRALGAIVDSVACVILRNPEAIDILQKEGLKLISLFTMEQLKENTN